MLPNDMDPECIALCEAMNKVTGITTEGSCCGHGERPYAIYFRVRRLAQLPRLLYWFDACHCGYYGWECRVRTDCAMSPVYFYVEGPVGEKAYAEALDIAKLITADLGRSQ